MILAEKSNDLGGPRLRTFESFRDSKNKTTEPNMGLNPVLKPFIFEKSMMFPLVELPDPFTMPQVPVNPVVNPIIRPAQFSYYRENEAGNFVHNHKNAPSTITKPEQMTSNKTPNKYTYEPVNPPNAIPSVRPLAVPIGTFLPSQKRILENPSGSRVKNGLCQPNALLIPQLPPNTNSIIAKPKLKIASHAVPNDGLFLGVTNTKMAEKTEPNATVSTSSHDSSKSKIDRDIYYKLRSMFSDVDSNYIKKICKKPPIAINVNNKEHLLNLLIDHLLNEGSNNLALYPTEDRQEPKSNNLSIDEQCNYLQEIFKDADPTYLRDFVEQNHHRENALEEFIQQKLEKRDYPTREQYLSKIKKTEQMKDYTVNFKVEKFLEIFPDPVTHFEDSARKCQYEPIAFEFFKSFFSRIKVSKEISQINFVNIFANQFAFF